MEDKKVHWEEIYKKKDSAEVSWYQPKAETSMEYIRKLKLKKSTRIIDIGGGDSFLAENLLAEGYTEITVLDISGKALDRARSRLGDKAKKITWIAEDVTAFSPREKYDLWHDRATFHFLTEQAEVIKYKKTVNHGLKANGYLVIGTFSEKGPEKCSGINVKQYSQQELTDCFKEGFNTLECKNVDHLTPSGAIQNFSFCSFQKRVNKLRNK